jgi:hypothetical protein
MITDGYVSVGLLIGARTRAWTREEILEIVTNGVRRRPRGKNALVRAARREAALNTGN